MQGGDRHSVLEYLRRVSPTWWRDLPAFGLLVVLITALTQLIVTRPSIDFVRKDTAFFVWSGIQMSRGRLVYVSYWDLKPPAVHELLGLFAVFVGGNLYLVGVAGLVLTIFATALSVFAIAETVFELMGDELAAFGAAITPLVLAEFYFAGVLNVRVQVFTAACAAVAIWLFVLEREAVAATAAALGAAFWQPGVGVLLVALWGAWHRGRARRALAATAGVTLLVLAPFLARGTIDPVIAQTVLAPLYTEGREPTFESLAILVDAFGLGFVVIPLAGVGWWLTRRLEHGMNDLAVSVIGLSWLWYLGFLVVVSNDGPLDFAPLLVLTAVLVGLAIAVVPDRLQDPETGLTVEPALVGVALVGLAVFSELLWLRHWPLAIDPGHVVDLDTYVGSSGCHVRLSYQEIWWRNIASRSPYIEACGDVEFLEIGRLWLRWLWPG